MSKPTILVAFGTRPEAVKLAPVVDELRRQRDLRVRVCVTAQHRQMLDQMLADFGLSPDKDLNLMEANQDLTRFSSRALLRLQGVLRKERPKLLLVQGDTTTSLIASLAAFHEGVPVGHVEAGLRSFDRLNPYPEEVNRILIDRLSELHFVPTAQARLNLLREGIPGEGIHVTGNTVVDALARALARPHRFQEPHLRRKLSALGPGDKAVLVTAHRRENLGRPLEDLCRAFHVLLQRHAELHLFYPVHRNPKVRRTVRRLLRHPRAHLLPPLNYFDLVHLLNRCHFAMTDSGGIQEEAPFLGKPVLVLRKATERPEVLWARVAKLVGTSPNTVVATASRLLRETRVYRAMARKTAIYGDGSASRRIAQAIRFRMGLCRRKPEDFRSKY